MTETKTPNRVQLSLTAEQVAELYNLLKAEVDWGNDLPPLLEELRQELKKKAKLMGMSFREGYVFPK